MRFLVDAHLPHRLIRILREAGHDAVHTRDLPLGNRTSDNTINALSLLEMRVVITKDADFVHSFVLHGRPFKLLLVSTGNLANRELLALFAARLEALVAALEVAGFVEMTRGYLVVHGGGEASGGA